MVLVNIFVFLFGFLMNYLFSPYFYSMLKSDNCMAENYLKHKIPIGMGVIFVIVQAFICIIVAFIYNNLQSLIFIYIITMLIISLVSLLDDLVGEKKTKGFKGHIFSLINGRLTTGGLKAIIGFNSAIVISVKLYENWSNMIINILLIALFINIINMFDLRPGRGLKVFIVLSLIMILTAFIREMDFIIYSVLGITLAYLPNDIKGLSMMGDVGSNFLGITLGFYTTVSQDHSVKIGLLVLLIFIHVLGEIYSFTNIINKNKVLRFFDNLGRQ